jgi:hypothetical protein
MTNNNLLGGLNVGEIEKQFSMSVGNYSIGASGIEYGTSPTGASYPIANHQTNVENVNISAGRTTNVDLHMVR